MSVQYLFVIIFAVVVVIWSVPIERARAVALRMDWLRSCSGRAWKREFPSVPKSDVRSFLQLFVQAFAFPRNRALQFLPSDRVFDVYQAIYPSKYLPDALELETLAKELDRMYRISLEELWSEELTLGQLFDVAVCQPLYKQL